MLDHVAMPRPAGPLADLIAGYQPGRSLERAFYTSPDIYAADMDRIWAQSWIWAGHISQIPHPGDFRLFSFGAESVILVRDRGGAVRAHLNVCRHRGSRVCVEPQGRATVFSCPYHAWTYNLDGSLRAGRWMGDDFDKAAHGLLPVSLEIIEGLIFICLGDDPPDLTEARQNLAPALAPFDLAATKVAAEHSYTVPANWKLAFENYVECYHCAPAHHEYALSHSIKEHDSMTPELVAAMRTRAAEVGICADEFGRWSAEMTPPGASYYHRRYPLFAGYETGSRDGQPVAPPLGRLNGRDGGATDVTIGPLNYFLIYSDHAVGYRFLPRDIQQTEMQIVWLVREDAVEGRDYETDRLTWLWDVTTKDDERIIRLNQQGVNSVRYTPGPLSKMESYIVDFLGWYIKMLSR